MERRAAADGHQVEARTSDRLAWSVLVVGALGFLALAVSYDDDPLAGWDDGLARSAAAHLPDVVELAARPLSWLGGWWGGLILAGLVLVHHVRARRIRPDVATSLDHAFVLVVAAGVALLANLPKLLFDRARPTIDPVVELPASSSFPSGHALTGVALLGAIAIVVIPRLERRATRVSATIAVVAVGLGVGLSRIVLGVHWATDVVAGWCLGLAWLAACVLGRGWVVRRGHEHGATVRT